MLQEITAAWLDMQESSWNNIIGDVLFFGIWVRDLIQEKNEGEHAMIEVRPGYVRNHSAETGCPDFDPEHNGFFVLSHHFSCEYKEEECNHKYSNADFN
ncbi:MAG: hypothetical protein FFODKBPE_00655 [Candidatus Argoarchaeum ethanivorans]|uniref:Uncharacterized protein n=1 Tax=Candidatus Argoarchaeum ethanivorans TaxID=2608793 RepID=A0A811THH5_9EURY|nr:MAG: hypothetical protein FFODKBPE_00655 [Candidatus Argoarchaeum ethanivorans]